MAFKICDIKLQTQTNFLLRNESLLRSVIGPENAHHSSQPVKCKTKTNHIFVFLIGMCDYLSFGFYNTQLKSAT